MISIRDGAFGRAADYINKSLELCSACVLENKDGLVPGMQGLFKNMGDFCLLARLVPGYVHLVEAKTLNQVVEAARLYMDGKDLGSGIQETLGLKDSVTVDVVLSVGISAYTSALVICREEKADVSDIVADYLHDISLAFFWRYSVESRDRSLLDKAIFTMKSALSIYPSSYSFWNTLAVIAMKEDPALSQHAFIRALEFDSKVFIFSFLMFL
jgi:superkiller protein 3